MEADRLCTVLIAVLQPEYSSKAVQWLNSSTPREVKGLKLLAAIYKHKGQKKFSSKLNITTSESVLSDISKEFGKRAWMSTYDCDFPAYSEAHTEATTMTGARFIELPCSRVLSASASRYLRNWISLRDSQHYLAIILETLRSILAFCNYPAKKTTENRQQFVWSSKARLEENELKYHLKARSSIGVFPKTKAKKRMMNVRAASVCQPFSTEQARQRRDVVMKGSGQVATWLIGASDMATSYQANFGTPYNKYPLPPLLDFHTSVALVRMVPNQDKEME